jgi:hypothetical protein
MRFDPVLLSKVPFAVVLGKYGFCSAALPFPHPPSALPKNLNVNWASTPDERPDG